MKLILTVDGEPVAAARPRVTRWGTYTPPKYKAFKAKVELCYKLKYGNEQLFERGVPLLAKFHFYRPIQKGLSKIEHARRASHKVRPTVKPDLDNYIKAIQDGLKASWFDDGQVTDYLVSKDYDERPRTEIEVRELTKNDDN